MALRTWERELCHDASAAIAWPTPPRPRAAQPAARRGCPPSGTRHLTIAHVDCDAFYATIEKRDDPSLVDKPVIVGGGKRGVVAAACYVARTYGMRSAMPMSRRSAAARMRSSQADDGEIRPRSAARSARSCWHSRRWSSRCPSTRPFSTSPARTPARHEPGESAGALRRTVERELGITVSIGLSANKFLAKIASDLDKPRGFAVLGQREAPAFLAPKPVGFIYGVGEVSAAGWRAMVFTDRRSAARRRDRPDAALGEEGRAALAARPWHRRAQGLADRETKSVSAETTFERDICDFRPLELYLWAFAKAYRRG